MARLSPRNINIAPALEENQLFKNPVAEERGIPQGVKNNIDAAAQGYNAAYNKGSFGTNHPILTAGLGALLMGPTGLLLPLIAKKNDQARKASAFEAYNNYVKGALENQKSADAIAQPRFERNDTNQGIQTEIDARRINPNTPMLDSQGIYSTDYLKDRRHSSLNPASLNFLDSSLNNQQAQSYGLPSQTTFGQQQTVNKDQQQTVVKDPMWDYSETPTIKANATEVKKPIYSSYDPNLLPTSISDSTFGNLQSALTSAANTGLSQGTERYKFDQEAPKRDAEVAKLKAESATQLQLAVKYAQEGKTEESRRALMAAQARAAQAEASLRNRTNPNLRGGGGSNPTASSEMARMYELGAFGKPGSPEALKAYSAALQNDPSGYTTQTVYTRDNQGHVTGSTSRRVPQSQSPSAGGPNTQVKRLIDKYK